MSKGSLHNRLMERDTRRLKIEVGMGATELSYTDRIPYTVVEIIAKNKIVVQEDNMEIKKGEEMTQNWIITPDPEGRKKTLVRNTKGWKVLGGYTYFRLGVRDAYYDYSF